MIRNRPALRQHPAAAGRAVPAAGRQPPFLASGAAAGACGHGRRRLHARDRHAAAGAGRDRAVAAQLQAAVQTVAGLVLLVAPAPRISDNYGAVVDRFAVQSVAETNLQEGGEWLSWKMLGLPRLRAAGWRRCAGSASTGNRSGANCGRGSAGPTGPRLALVLVAVLLQRPPDRLTLRNHRELGHLANLAVLSASLSYAHHLRGTVAGSPRHSAAMRADAGIGRGRQAGVRAGAGDPRARPASLGGYARDTNPELAPAHRLLPQRAFLRHRHRGPVPCMFSNLGRGD